MEQQPIEQQPSEQQPTVDEHGLEIEDGETVWRFDREFLESNWTCIWGRGCQGIGVHAAPELARGCCSLGAELDGLDETMMVAASADGIDPAMFEHYELAAAEGCFSDASRTNTRVVDGACIFLNRPGFEGGAGCALHLAAMAVGESPLDWKPSVCWQVPIKVDWEMGDDNIEVATVRRWSRTDWGADGHAMAWCCTDHRDGGEAYIGTTRVIDSLAEELEAIVGADVFVALRRKLEPGST
jgi:hypothetical protein